MAVDDGVDLVGALRRLVDALRVAGDDLRRWRGTARRSARRRRRRGRWRAAVAAASGAISRGARERRVETRSCARRYSVGRARRRPARCTSRPENNAVSVPGAIGEKQVGLLAGRGAARIDHHDAWRRARAGCASCAGTAPDGTRRRSSRPGRSGRPRRGPRSSRAPCPRRRRGDGRRPTTPCTGANWCRRWPSRGSPSSACWRRNSPRSEAGRRDRTRPRPARARSMTRRKPSATVDRARCPSRRARGCRRLAAASDAAGGRRARASRPAQSPSSTAARNSPDARDRRR